MCPGVPQYCQAQQSIKERTFSPVAPLLLPSVTTTANRKANRSPHQARPLSLPAPLWLHVVSGDSHSPLSRMPHAAWGEQCLLRAREVR